MANPNWYKGMPRVPTSGRKKGTRNKHTTAVKKAQQVATLQMAQRTPEIVAAASEMILDKNQNIWVRVKLIETWLRYALPIPQVTVEAGNMSVDAAGDLAVTVIRKAEEEAEDLVEPKSIEATVISEDDQNAN